MKKKEKDIDLGCTFELAEENEIRYNQVPVNILIEDMEKMKIGFFTTDYFTPGDEGVIETNKSFRDSGEVAKIIDKILDKDDDHRSIHYTGKNYKYFGNC